MPKFGDLEHNAARFRCPRAHARAILVWGLIFTFGCFLRCAAADDIPRWRWDAVVAALEDPSMGVKQRTLEWLNENRSESDWYQPPSDVRYELGKFFQKEFAARPTDQELWPLLNTLESLQLPPESEAVIAPKIAELIKSSDYSVRYTAVTVLGQMGTNSAPYALQVFELLSETNEEVRQSTVAALGHMGTNAASVAPRVVDLLRNTTEDVRTSATSALGELGPSAAPVAPEVVDLLKGTDDEIASAAANALGQMGTNATGAVPQIAALLKSKNEKVRLHAFFALFNMGRNASSIAPEVAELLHSTNDQADAAQVLGQLGADALPFAPQLAELLKSPDKGIRNSGAYALGRIGPSAGMFAPRVAALLKSPDENSLVVAAVALGRMGSNAAPYASRIVELLRSTNVEVRSAAADALGDDIGPNAARVVPQVMELLKSTDAGVREFAGYALSNMRSNAAPVVPRVVQLLNSPDTEVRVSTIKLLGKVAHRSTPVALQLVDLLKSQESDERDAAVEALGEMDLDAAQVAPRVAELLKNNDDDVRRAAVNVLRSMGSDAAAFTPRLVELLQSDNDQLRFAAVSALGQMGTNIAPFVTQIADLLKSPANGIPEVALGVLLKAESEPDSKVTLLLMDASYSDRRLCDRFTCWAYLMGGANAESRLRILWLPNREDPGRLDSAKLNRTEAAALLVDLADTFPQTQERPAVRKRVAELGSEVVRAQRANGIIRPTSALASAARQLKGEIATEFPDQAQSIAESIRLPVSRVWMARGLAVLSGHALFWALLIFAYPRSPMIQAVFFWNKWTRRMFGLGYVGLVITLVPWLRRRLFQPFRESLVPKRLMDGYDAASYFDETEVIEEGKGNQPGARQKLREAVPEVRGQIVLQGQSGLGKTLLLKQLALKGKRTLVFLRATNCAEGVLTAIQRRLQGQARDEVYLQTLIYAGALDVLIDGLNEASPEARVHVSQFVEEYFKGNFVLTTQPMKWEPPATAMILELQPLRPEQIEAFLRKQWAAVASIAKLTEEDYGRAVSAYVSDLLKSGTDGAANPKLLALCNPMDGSLAAELIARGETPELLRLVEQRFICMNEAFREKNGRNFPREAFAEKVYEWRKADRADMDVAGFEVEASELAEHHLMIQREDEVRTVSGQEKRNRWFFRHDRIMEFFLAPAFLGSKNKQRRIDHIEDERFLGVYELLAVQLPDADEKELYTFLNDWAANTNQNELRNRYELARRKRVGRRS